MRPTLASFFFITIALAHPATAQSAGRWKEIGKTSAGNPVYVDPKTVKIVNGITTARIRVKFVKPVDVQNDKWFESRHTAMFDCAKRTVGAKESVYYGDAAATKVVKRDVIAKPGFGPAIGGSMTQIALDYFCKK
jgi:hypothetical protein